MIRCPRLLLAILLAGALASVAWAHAFPQKSSPPADATLDQSPATVKIWFTGEIEPVFSTLVVKTAAGKTVSVGKGAVSPDDPVLLQTRLPASLPAGTYSVYWSVVAHDGHHTSGKFAFTIR